MTDIAPPPLNLQPLFTLTLDVDFAATTLIGVIPAGRRSIAPVTGGRFGGPRLNGSVRPGADWVIARPDGVVLIDVRLTLDSDDGAVLYLSYQGRLIAPPTVLGQLFSGASVDPAAYSLVVTARLECGDTRYTWVNDSVIVGVGEQRPTGVTYRMAMVG